jgi:hypothetical protein
MRLATVEASASGSRSGTLRSLWSWQRWMTGWSNTSLTARRSALAPSITTRMGRVTSSPRSRSPASRSRVTVAFSVAPSASPSGTLVPSIVMPQGDHAAVLGYPDAVDHERHQVQPRQVGAHELGQGPFGRGDEPAGDRRPGGPRARLFGSAADWLQPGLVVAGRQLGQHPFQRQLVEQLAAGERLPGGQSQLSGAVGGADPRAVDPHPAAAEGDFAGLGAVTDRGPVGLMAALGAGQPLDVGVQQALQHAQAGPNGKGEQALAGGAGQLGERDRDPFGQHQLGVGGQGRVRMLGHVAVRSGRAAWSLPDTYHTAGHRAGTATSSSTKSGTTSRLTVTRR